VCGEIHDVVDDLDGVDVDPVLARDVRSAREPVGTGMGDLLVLREHLLQVHALLGLEGCGAGPARGVSGKVLAQGCRAATGGGTDNGSGQDESRSLEDAAA
jgi:hypothetical protein